MADHQQPQQPNFQRAVEHLTAFTEEVALCGNIPAIQQGNQILDAIRGLEQRMEQRLTQMEQRLTRMETSIAGLVTNVARLETR